MSDGINPEEYAFPIAPGDVPYWQPGMSLREWYAGQALAGWLASFGPDDAMKEDQVADFTFRMADAMMARARSQAPTGEPPSYTSNPTPASDMPTTRQFLDLSTAHIRPSTIEAITGRGLTTLLIGECGWLIWIPSPDDPRPFWPPELREAFRIARERYPEAEYLMFDGDAPQNRDFPTYNEEWT